MSRCITGGRWNTSKPLPALMHGMLLPFQTAPVGQSLSASLCSYRMQTAIAWDLLPPQPAYVFIVNAALGSCRNRASCKNPRNHRCIS